MGNWNSDNWFDNDLWTLIEIERYDNDLWMINKL